MVGHRTVTDGNGRTLTPEGKVVEEGEGPE